jgi:hypothetical protein
MNLFKRLLHSVKSKEKVRDYIDRRFQELEETIIDKVLRELAFSDKLETNKDDKKLYVGRMVYFPKDKQGSAGCYIGYYRARGECEALGAFIKELADNDIKPETISNSVWNPRVSELTSDSFVDVDDLEDCNEDEDA